MLKKVIAVLAASCVASCALAADLFVDGKLREIKPGNYVSAGETIGGYPIIQNEGDWIFSDGKAYTSNGGSDPVRMGYVQLEYLVGGALFARQFLAVNTAAGSNGSWGGTPCAQGHLVMRDLGQGKLDNCMTIDAQAVNVGGRQVAFLNVILTNSASAGRYYRIVFSINADLLGVLNSGTTDWTPDEVKDKPYKKEAIDRLTAWATQLQDASIKAFGTSRPTDVYTRLPSFMTLLPVPEDLVGQMRSIAFVTAVEDLRHSNTIKSIAYSRFDDYKGAWGSIAGQSSQTVADTAALAKCESMRVASKPTAPKCELYRIRDGKRYPDIYEFKH